jgi:signal transduction histidine kinase
MATHECFLGTGSRTRFTITAKILLAVGGGLLLSLLTMASLYTAIITVDAAREQVAQVAEPISTAATEMEINVSETGLGVMMYLETGALLYRTRVDKDTADFARFKAQYDRLAATPQAKALGDRIAFLYQEFRAVGDMLMRIRDRHEQLLAEMSEHFETIGAIFDDQFRARLGQESLQGQGTLLAMMEMKNDMAAVGTWLGQYLQAANHAYRIRIVDHTNALQERLTRFTALPLTAVEQYWTSELERRFTQTTTLMHEVLTLHDTKSAWIEQFLQLRTALDNLLDEGLQRLTRHALTTAKEASRRAVHRARVRLVALIVLSLVLSVGILVSSRYWLLRPLLQLVMGAQAIGRGQLDHRMAVSTQDELGMLAATFNQMAESLQQEREALWQAHNTLEQQVQERTTTLAHTVEQLQHSRLQVRALAARMLSIQEEERKRIAHEVHDELGQALTALILDLTWVGQRLPTEQTALRQKIDSMVCLTDKALDMLGDIVAALRPRVLDDLGIAAAVEWQVREFHARTGIAYTLTIDPEHICLDAARSIAVFRILQEVLTNVMRHADATMLSVDLRIEGGILRLEVRDNGRGIPDQAVTDPQSFGILGMHERVLPWRGEVEIYGNQGEGTVVTVHLPLTDTVHEETCRAQYSHCR